MLLKDVHITCAYVTGLGFLLRGILAIQQHSALEHRATRTLPHVIDSVLLASARGLLYTWGGSPASLPWLIAKILALLVYIAFGLLMLRWGATQRRRVIGFMGGLLTYAYIVGAAHSKSIFSWAAFMTG